MIRRPWLAPVTLVGVVLVAAIALLSAGRPAICTCGYVKLWEGAVHSAGNSQHLADWYSFSHVIHGFLFFAAARLAMPRAPVGWRLVAAAVVEAAWEIFENSPVIIDRYRAATMAFGYSGDSVLNSASDIAMMAAGFLVASRLNRWVTALIAVAFELFTLWTIRDNLTLNIVMLLWPIDAIREWQDAI